MNDHYLSVKGVASGEYKEKGSKFLAFVHPIDSEAEIKSHLDNYKKEYYDARHVCYAYTFGIENEVLKSSDAGEPNGTAGLPILNQIRSSGLKNILVIVVRYFGGTKLGASGLVTAYKAAAKSAIENAIKIEKPIVVEVEFEFPYLKMNSVMKMVKDYAATILEQDFGNDTCCLKVQLLKSKEEEFVQKIDF